MNETTTGIRYDPNCYRCREKAGRPRAGYDRVCVGHKDAEILMHATNNARLREQNTRLAELALEQHEALVTVDSWFEHRAKGTPPTAWVKVRAVLARWPTSGEVPR